ncbi:glycine cleavage system protein R [Alteromonadaceae bacterium M269]|nr:glycine cleavage system protein R [Alteromonadaceae bacterium M269]
MKTLIIGLVGADKPGLIDSVAQTIYQAEGNWLSSNFAHMAGQFAGFVEVQVPQNAIQSLEEKLAAHPDLQIQINHCDESSQAGRREVAIEVVGNDRKGIVQELSSILNSFDLNIVKFESLCESAPNWGSILFKAKASVEVDEHVDLDELKEALENIANDIVVELIPN